jgi:hypothetical protein
VITAFINNLTLAVLALAGAASVIFIVLLLIAGAVLFFGKLKEEGSALKAWTVGIAIAVVILAGVKTWYFGK